MMTTPDLDAASVAAPTGDPAEQVVAQFEPDFDGTWDAAAVAPGDGAPALDDGQWIVWADAALQAAWAAGELAAEWLAAARLSTTR